MRQKLVTLVLIVTALVSCNKAADFDPEGAKTETQTVGNHSYLTFPNRAYETPSQEVLEALDEFEKKHSDLEISTWKLDVSIYGAKSKVLGVWIDHHPRPK